MKRIVTILCIVMTAAVSWAGQNISVPLKKFPGKKCYTYRVTLKDKRGCGFSIDKPKQFLSQKAIDRRRKQNLPLDSTDLPVNRNNVRAILASTEEITLLGTSKWNNTVVVNLTDTTAVEKIRKMEFVSDCKRVWTSPDSITPNVRRKKIKGGFSSWDSLKNVAYGSAFIQIHLMNGEKLHERGFRGKGMTIAVLDGGFANVDRLSAFKNVKVTGARDFVFPRSTDIYNETDHGTKVLSTMAMNAPTVYIGTAPDASYWLLRCEDQQTEQPVEEDYWAMAAEFADSVGVDIISSSLGYNEYDNHYGDHHYYEMDGKTTLISRTASMLADKGIILVNSAGNYGMGPWKKITFPADAENIITVGALTATLQNAPFSGIGPTQDGRIKPDVMAIGSPATLISARGTVIEDMGTSFSTPIVCGLIACLWQARPEKNAKQIMDIVRQSANNYCHPDNIYGYGVPDFEKALRQ
ncbi:MAG: S8 family serine peptidase [Prevotella sp.]|nr:S8 family serine peptidase [Prevotella sp.]